MWPMIQPDDSCTFHPAQAVSGRQGLHAIQKEESEIHVGDVVFCQVQPGLDYYAHIVLEIHFPKNREHKETSYVIGHIKGYQNGKCYRKDIFGVLVSVQAFGQGRCGSRPLLRTIFSKVQPMVKRNKYNRAAAFLCEAIGV